MTRYSIVTLALLSVFQAGFLGQVSAALAQGQQEPSVTIKIVTGDKEATLEKWLQAALAKSQTPGISQVQVTSVKINKQGQILVLGVIPDALAADRAPLQKEIEEQFVLGEEQKLIVWADEDNNPLPKPVVDVSGMTTKAASKPTEGSPPGAKSETSNGAASNPGTPSDKSTPRGPTPKDGTTEKPSTPPGTSANIGLVDIMTQDPDNPAYVPQPLKLYVVNSLLDAKANTGYDDVATKIETIEVYSDGHVVLKGKVTRVEDRNKIGDAVKTLLTNAITSDTIDWKKKGVVGDPQIDNQLALPIAKRPLLAVLQGILPQDVNVTTIEIRGNVVLVRGSALDGGRLKEFERQAAERVRQLYDLNGLEESFDGPPSLDISGIEVSAIELEEGLLKPKARARGINLTKWYWSGGKSQYLNLVGTAPNIDARTAYAKEVETILRSAMADGRFPKVGSVTVFVVVREVLLPGMTPESLPGSANGSTSRTPGAQTAQGEASCVRLPVEVVLHRESCGRPRRWCDR